MGSSAELRRGEGCWLHLPAQVRCSTSSRQLGGYDRATWRWLYVPCRGVIRSLEFEACMHGDVCVGGGGRYVLLRCSCAQACCSQEQQKGGRGCEAHVRHMWHMWHMRHTCGTYGTCGTCGTHAAHMRHKEISGALLAAASSARWQQAGSIQLLHTGTCWLGSASALGALYLNACTQPAHCWREALEMVDLWWPVELCFAPVQPGMHVAI